VDSQTDALRRMEAPAWLPRRIPRYVQLLLCTAAFVLRAQAQSVPSMMTSVHKFGFLPCFSPFKCVRERTVPVPKPGPGQLLVRVAASSVNPCDVDYLELGVGCSGGGGNLGMDLAGTVVEMGQGEGCDDGRLQVGDAVWADGGGVGGDTGGMAQYAVVRCSQTGRAPKSINLTAAGTIPLVGFTSLECLALTGAPWSKANLTVVRSRR
jgi:hypothetical protein